MNDPFMSCPYDVRHRVPRSRIQAHIIKCQAKYPSLQICPYNATHRVPAAEIKTHVNECPSRKTVATENNPPEVVASISSPQPFLQTEFLPKTDPNYEIWDL